MNLDESDDDSLNLNEEDDGTINFDVDEDNDDIMNLDEDDNSADIMKLDEDENDDDILKLDDDDDNDILKLDNDDDNDDILNLDEDDDNDILKLDDDEDDSIINSSNDDESVDGEILDLDSDLSNIPDKDDGKDVLSDGTDELKINDDASTEGNGTFEGIKNKNFNLGYDLSKQIKEINDSEEPAEKDKNIRLNLLQDQKVMAFVGVHGNGTSFIINNLACLLSEQGIKVAIVDLTKNKNSYYIYTENTENLRSIAFSCFDKLKSGISDGIKVNKNLTVFTSLPNADSEIDDKEVALNTILNNNSLVLLDCDTDTDLEYFGLAQEVYLVQSLDILTIQQLTAFLKKWKMSKTLDESKLRILINKQIRVDDINDRIIISAMSVYNSPDTTYQLDLFNRDTIQYLTIPFEERNYVKYLGEVARCKLKISGYSKALTSSFNKLAKMIYPIGKKNNK